MSWMQTASGGKFYFDNPQLDSVKVEDIAHALANICRFGGHCRHHYSVAQHSVLVSMLVPREQALAALFHDASEAYLGDVVHPLKCDWTMADYRALERRVQSTIEAKLNLPLGSTHTAEIKAADLAMLAREREALLPDQETPWDVLEGVEPADINIFPMSPESARELFMLRYQQLSGV